MKVIGDEETTFKDQTFKRYVQLWWNKKQIKKWYIILTLEPLSWCRWLWWPPSRLSLHIFSSRPTARNKEFHLVFFSAQQLDEENIFISFSCKGGSFTFVPKSTTLTKWWIVDEWQLSWHQLYLLGLVGDRHSTDALGAGTVNHHVHAEALTHLHTRLLHSLSDLLHFVESHCQDHHHVQQHYCSHLHQKLGILKKLEPLSVLVLTIFPRISYSEWMSFRALATTSNVCEPLSCLQAEVVDYVLRLSGSIQWAVTAKKRRLQTDQQSVVVAIWSTPLVASITAFFIALDASLVMAAQGQPCHSPRFRLTPSLAKFWNSCLSTTWNSWGPWIT